MPWRHEHGRLLATGTSIIFCFEDGVMELFRNYEDGNVVLRPRSHLALPML